MTTRLSKSRIMSSLQCPKRVHLEVNRPELAKYTSAAEAAFALGHQVGEMATKIYDNGNGTLVEYSGGSFSSAIRLTGELMGSLLRAPIFEATIEHQSVLVREDVLLPVGDSDWHLVEVKASTKLKPAHVHDCAIQAWVHIGAGYPLSRVALAHIDRGFEYQGGDDYDGLLVEQDITGQVFDLQPSVPLWVERARDAVEGPMPDISVGAHCRKPYECPFIEFCWPSETPYPVQGLGGNAKKLGEWIGAGYRDIRDVPASKLVSDQQRRIRRITLSGTAELLPGAHQFADALPYPRYYLDFETINPAIPIWPGTRPYQMLPFQWSLHIERQKNGALDHAEFLDLSGDAPMRSLAESLISACGSDGPVLVYTDFEARRIRELAELFADLTTPLQAILSRLVDLHPVTRANYYHPDMLGSWSIKAVLPTIAPDMDYAALEGIHEGTEASAAYLEAINPATPSERRGSIRSDLLRYCRHDTEAMVRLMRFFQSS